MVGARALGIFSAVDRLGMVMRERKRRMRRMDVLRMGRAVCEGAEDVLGN